MKKLYTLLTALVLTIAATGQTLNIRTGSVTWQFPASQTGDMTYADGETLTIMGKTFNLADIDAMTVDDTEVSDDAVSVSYDATGAAVTIAGNVAQYLTPTVSGAHVSIAQSDDLASEVTYTLNGSTTDGEFYMSGSYKATIELNGVTLKNTTPVYSGAAIHIQNGKRIKVKIVSGTTNTLSDAASGSQKGCFYVKGHAEFAQKGTLNVVGNLKHGIKTGEYMTLKNATINVTSAVADGINSAAYFLMESGTVTISGVGDDGIQCDVDGDTSTGETTDHEDEDSGNIYIAGGTLTVTTTGAATKGIKSQGDMKISDGTLNVTTTGNGAYDSDEKDAKGCGALKSDGNMTISGGTLTLKSTGTGGKCIKADGTLTVTGGTITATTTGTKYTYSSKVTASPKAIKSNGAMTISGGTIVATSSNHEGIESKSTLTVTGGNIYGAGGDDGINSTSDMYLKGGYVFARTTGTGTGADGFDANGNLYIQGATAFGISHGTPDVGFDANSEGGKKLYLQSGNLVAIGGLESGASLTQSCYSTSSYTKGSWYGLYSGSTLVLAFQVPSSGTMGSGLVVSTSGTATLKKGITVSSGTSIWNGLGYADATVSGGSSVTLSSYTGGSGGGGGWPGGGPGGWH